MPESAVLGQLVETVLASSKYQHVDRQLVQQIGAQELVKYPHLKEAVKATKNKLHQVAGSYRIGKADYATWLATLQQAADDPAQVRACCLAIMQHHASTQERLRLLDEFYPTLFAGLPPVTTLLDLACGLNPLTLPWMPLGQPVTYYAYDIYQDQIAFLNQCFPLLGVQGVATTYDLLQGCPHQPADVALLLKTIPCLRQVDKAIGLLLLEAIAAPVLLVSFPIQSLGGHAKGMNNFYDQLFRDMVAEKNWRIERFDFATELVFRIFK